MIYCSVAEENVISEDGVEGPLGQSGRVRRLGLAVLDAVVGHGNLAVLAQGVVSELGTKNIRQLSEESMRSM